MITCQPGQVQCFMVGTADELVFTRVVEQPACNFAQFSRRGEKVALHGGIASPRREFAMDGPEELQCRTSGVIPTEPNIECDELADTAVQNLDTIRVQPGKNSRVVAEFAGRSR